MLQPGHVRRAAHILPYFCGIYRSPVLSRPLCAEPNSAHLRARRLTDVMLHARSTTHCTIGRASSILEGELHAGWLVSGVADFCGYSEQRIHNATFTAGIRFVALCIITLSWTSAARGDTGQCIGDGTHMIVGNADLTILHSALAIMSDPAIELGSKITSLIWTNNLRFAANNQIRTLLYSDRSCWD